MGFFEESYVVAKEAIGAASKKTGELVEVQKLRLNIAKLNAQMSKDYETLGQLIYAIEKNGGDKTQLVASMISSIDLRNEQMADFKQKLADMKGMAVCGQCSAPNPAEAVFCNQCGTSLNVEPPAWEPETDAAPDTGADSVPAEEAKPEE